MAKRFKKRANPKGGTPTPCIPNGLVIGRVGPVFKVRGDDGRLHDCLGKGEGKRAVIGDRVRVEAGVMTDLSNAILHQVAPRDTELVRMDALGRRPQTVAANLSRVFIVCAVLPELREGLIDRYLVAADRQDIPAEIVLNKVDLLSDSERDFWSNRLAAYRRLGWPVHEVSAHNGEGLKRLAAAFIERTSILVGHSGVGKTSLINALCPGVEERVKEISEATGKGTHTTTTSAMYALPAGGAVIDSPGIRSFGLWGVSAESLREHFREFVELQSSCRFSDCQHLKEPQCAIRLGVESGDLDERRYLSYRAIRESLLDGQG